MTDEGLEGMFEGDMQIQVDGVPSKHLIGVSGMNL
jgi:hypothetical protein